MITIPENLWKSESILYEEILKRMSHCYFVDYSSKEDLNKCASEEFSRIRNVLCRYYDFNEEKYIDDNDGLSPFDAVRNDVEKEVCRRIRKDIHLTQLVRLRKSLTSKIEDAVIKHGGYIDMLYLTEQGDTEYEDSPIVVSNDDSAFRRYGGYEAATILNLYRNGSIHCTLNGESGENFEQPISAVQIEGLIEIAHWLEEYGFISSEEDDPYVCGECGSQDIQTQAWVNPNTHEYIGTTEEDRDDNWCDECEEHNYFCLKSEFEERMQTWWEETDFTAMERITGYRQDDFSPEDGYQEFVDVCNDWWHKKSYDERRAVWNEYHEHL